MKLIELGEIAFILQGVADHRACSACMQNDRRDTTYTPTGYLVGTNGKRYPCPACHGTKTEDHGVRFVIREVMIIQRVHIVQKLSPKKKREEETYYLCSLTGVNFDVQDSGVFHIRINAETERLRLQRKRSLQPLKGLGVWMRR